MVFSLRVMSRLCAEAKGGSRETRLAKACREFISRHKATAVTNEMDGSACRLLLLQQAVAAGEIDHDHMLARQMA
jgi:hypothetical protein